MNEATQVLNQTNHERKVAGYGVHHKKGGSAVAKLGNRPMSDQEIQSKHGECKDYDLGGFMDYETFKKMDPDLEAEYVNNLCEKYHVRHEQISKYLFELGENDLMARLKIKGVDKKITKIKASDVTDDAVKGFCDQIDFWHQKIETAKIIDLSEAQHKCDIIENAEFISYEKYRTFSDTEKLNYVNNLVDRYDVGRSIISKVLFGKSESTLDQYFYTKDLKSSLHMTKPCAPDARKEKTKVFTDAVNAWRGESVVEETVPEQPKEKPETVARDILAAIIGKEPEKPSDVIAKILQVDKVKKPAEVTAEEPKKDDLPESNISAVYIPVTREKFDDTVAEVSVEPIEESDDNTMPAREPVENAATFVEQPVIPKATPKPSSEVYFSTRYISEKGLDRETILNKIYRLASLFENEENLEVTLTVATKKEA